MKTLLKDIDRTTRTKKYLRFGLKKYYKMLGKNFKKDNYSRPRLILEDMRVFTFYDNFFRTYFKNKRVIDVGCANGFFSIWIGMYAKSVLGIDNKPINLRVNNIMLKASELSNVDFRTMSAFDISRSFLRDNKINGIFWHKTGFGEKNMDFYNTILCYNVIDVIICNFGPIFSDDYLKTELNYDIHWKDKVKPGSGKGRLYVLESNS